jgi:hypothetical protein
MSSIISALDNFTPSQIGENGSTEYTWSNSLKETICQIDFQLTRTRDSNTLDQLALKTDGVLNRLFASYKSQTISREEYLDNMSIMFRMIGKTRDIVDGKGEYSLSYMLLDVWDKHFPNLAQFALRYFVLNLEGTDDTHPYGSWKDIKYLYKRYQMSPLVLSGARLLLDQIRKDVTSENPSLAAKWVPREKSSFGGLFCELANLYYPEYLLTAKCNEQRKRAVLKAKTEFRKVISSLNKKLDTVQIKQCGQNWSSIDPCKQTSITMHKQKRAFLNKNKNGEQRSESEDRIACAQNFVEFAAKAERGEVQVKGKRVGLNSFTEEALNLIRYGQNASSEAAILNAQWLDNGKQTGALGKMIAMVDVSGSMNGDPLNAAIALGIRVAERSALGKRVLTFSSSPTWVNLDGYNSFVDMVDVLKDADWGQNTNFHAAMKLILDAIIENNINPEDVKDMVLVIFSDMQIDESGCGKNLGSLMGKIQDMYSEAGIRIHGKPFDAPHILFWNLRSTGGFPALSTVSNCSMMSGFSPALLNLFCEKGMEALESCTPWSMLLESLNKERFMVLDKYLRETL